MIPYLTEDQRFRFPDPNQAEEDIVAIGGNLSPGMLLSAYEQGIFPWYNPKDPILWQSPDPRFVLFPAQLHISSSMQKILRQGRFRVTFNEDFAGVIQGCASVVRPGQDGTWIGPDIIEAYTEMHRLGWVISAESWAGGELVGGCYGLRLNQKVFCGESMFTRQDNASKAAFLTLATVLFRDGVEFIDCQVHTRHLESLGGVELRRRDFLRLLRAALD